MRKVHDIMAIIVSTFIVLVCFGVLEDAQIFLAETIAQIMFDQIGMYKTLKHVNEYATYVAWGIWIIGALAICNIIDSVKNLFKD